MYKLDKKRKSNNLIYTILIVSLLFSSLIVLPRETSAQTSGLEIDEITCPTSISPGNQGKAIVEVVNKAGYSGSVFIETSKDSETFDIIPETTPAESITDRKVFDFTIKYNFAGDEDKDVKLSFEACNSNELGTKCSSVKSCTVTAKKEGSRGDFLSIIAGLIFVVIIVLAILLNKKSK